MAFTHTSITDKWFRYVVHKCVIVSLPQYTVVAGVCGESTSKLTMLTSCICPGYEIVFECTVAGVGGTIWHGTALEECTDGRIILRHSQFESGYNITQTCGASGTIIGHAVSVENDFYTSQLTINVSQHLNGSTVECASDSGRQVGSRQILHTTGMKVDRM